MTTHRVGIDVGGTKCLGVIIDADGAVVEHHRVETPRDPGALIATIAELSRRLLGAVSQRDGGVVDEVGLGMPGLVTRHGVLRAAPNLVDVVDLAVGDEIARRVGVTVHVDNDATCAAVAEWRCGAAAGETDAIVVTLGTGIGGGLIAGGRVQRGANGFAGEIGHMVIDPDGPVCPCGRSGCWERYASGSALAALAAAASWSPVPPGSEPVRGEDVIDATRRGDPAATAVLDGFARWIALGLANLTNIADPACFVLGGGVMQADDLLLPRVRAWMGELLYAPRLRPHPEVRAARFGETAGAVGAALLGLTVDAPGV